MNVNGLLYGLREVTGYPTEQDVYDGKRDRFIVFTYEDERPVMAADNRPVADQVTVMVSLFGPEDYEYMSDKEKIRDYLEKSGFCVTSIRQWKEQTPYGSDRYIRRVTFHSDYTEMRQEEQ